MAQRQRKPGTREEWVLPNIFVRRGLRTGDLIERQLVGRAHLIHLLVRKKKQVPVGGGIRVSPTPGATCLGRRTAAATAMPAERLTIPGLPWPACR